MTSYGLNDTVALPPGYYSALEWGLAVLLGAIQGLVNPSVVQLAASRKERLETRNLEVGTLSLNALPLNNGSRYNINTDQMQGRLV